MSRTTSITTWHYGLCARYWSEVVGEGGEDADRFQDFIETPALDVGCGTGRLLIPFGRAGLDVDGADASADMIDYCRANAARAGLAPALHVQALHELDIERRYRTIYLCGTLGLGGPEFVGPGIERAYEHLLPGGRLVFDHYLPVGRDFRGWIEPPALPQEWPEEGPREPLPDGAEISMVTRRVAFDPLTQETRQEIRLRLYEDGQCVAEDTFALVNSIIFKLELERMLATAGFVDIDCIDWETGAPPAPWQSRRLLVAATRPGEP